jgi:hypothetical protein
MDNSSDTYSPVTNGRTIPPPAHTRLGLGCGGLAPIGDQNACLTSIAAPEPHGVESRRSRDCKGQKELPAPEGVGGWDGSTVI